MPRSTGNRSAPRWYWQAAVVGAVLAMVGACAGSNGTAKDSGSSRAGRPLVLEPVSSRGADPFTSSVAVRQVAEFPASVTAVTRKVQAEAEPAGGGSASSGGGQGQVISGSVPGLYGGSGDEAVCDAPKLVTFLSAHADEAKAWAGVEGVAPDGIERFVSGLTPVVLTADTWVTNHGFTDGRATPRQSVLERGTAVMVDSVGVPRVKCGCGNPLLAPVRTGVDLSEPVGDPWAGYAPQRVTEVEPSKEPIPIFTTTDIKTGDPIQTKPVGSASGGDLSSVDFRNFTYTVTADEGTAGTVTLADGNFVDPRGPEYGTVSLKDVTVVDVDGDGTAEALVTLLFTQGNSGASDVRVFASGPDGPQQVGDPLPGTLSGPVDGSSGEFSLETPVYLESDPRCCPSRKKVTTYRYQDGAVTEIGSEETGG